AQNSFPSNQLGKLPPQVLELEEAVLGALMIEKDALNQVIDVLRPESFYKTAHQEIYQAIFELFSESEPIDMLTVTQRLRFRGKLEMVGGPSYIMRLTSSVNSAANIEYHARIITEQAIKRELISIATEIQKDAFEDSTDVFDLLDSAEQKLFQISESNIRKNFSTMSPLVQQAIKEIESRKDIKDGLTGIPTGFTALDRITAGWQKSDLVILAARPGMGKCLSPETKVLLYNGELKEAQYIRPGDQLMGPDSKPRKVLSIGRGWEKMYWIRQDKALDYRVNESHILSLKPSQEDTPASHINVADYLQTDEKFKQSYLGYKVGIDFPQKTVKVEPYYLGYWLPNLLGKLQISSQASILAGEEAQLYSQLEAKKTFIPPNYIINSREKRLALLAGLLDALGSYQKDKGQIVFRSPNEPLLQQIKFLGDSLGFRTLTGKNAGLPHLSIQGTLSEIPSKCFQFPPSKKRDFLRSPIRVEYDKEDLYCGFELDGDGLFLLEDMTVTHNTAFCLSAMRNAAVDFSSPVAFFSLEMSELQLVNRLISAEAELESNKIKIGKLEEYEWQQLYQRTTTISEAPIFIDDTPALSVLELRAKCRRLKAQHDIQLIMVDYLQLMTANTGKGNQGNREQEIATISRNLKNIAKELNVPVIALSQLSRAVETRGGDKRPQLSDLRESGCLTGDTLILNGRTGALTPIKELAERAHPTTLECIGIDELGKLNAENMCRVFYSGIKPVYRMTTQSGRSIKASANHPFLSQLGWRRLDELKIGEEIALAQNVQISGGKSVSKSHIQRLVARLEADALIPEEVFSYDSEGIRLFLDLLEQNLGALISPNEERS
ncbi:MAG: replicative DNA helicase, partial [Bacteroidota bacterium]